MTNRNPVTGTAPADTFNNVQAMLALVQQVTTANASLSLNALATQGLNLALTGISEAVAYEQQEAKQRELRR